VAELLPAHRSGHHRLVTAGEHAPARSAVPAAAATRRSRASSSQASLRTRRPRGAGETGVAGSARTTTPAALAVPPR
jgi:hypothetical protein